MRKMLATEKEDLVWKRDGGIPRMTRRARPEDKKP